MVVKMTTPAMITFTLYPGDPEMDDYGIEAMVRALISAHYPDWKEWVTEWVDTINTRDMVRCPSCESKLYTDGIYCCWCGYKIGEDK